MKKGIQTSLFKVGVISALAAGILTGCGSREERVDYAIDGITEKEQPQREGGKSGLLQFEEEEMWKETCTLKVGESESEWGVSPIFEDIQVNANISVPQTQQVAVIEVEEPVFDAAYEKTLAENIFDSKEIYYGDIAHLPRKDLEKLQPDQLTQEQKEILNHIDIANAGDIYTLADEYKVDEYIGSYAGILYHLSFAELAGERCRQKQIIMTPQNLEEICPEKYRKQEDLACTPWMFGDWAENECRLSEDDAKKEARLFIENLGLDYSVISCTRPLIWGDSSEIYDLTGVGESDTWGVNGYVFSFDLGIDDISFVDFGTEDDYGHYWYYGSEWSWLNIDTEGNTQYSLNARLDIYITDQGIVRMVINNPMEITGVSEGVELLPLDTIKRMTKEIMEKQWKSLRFDYDTKYFDEMELIYFRVQDKDNLRKYSYVPTWRLSSVTRDTAAHKITIRNPVFINAIDGSAVDYFNEIYDMQPIE